MEPRRSRDGGSRVLRTERLRPPEPPENVSRRRDPLFGTGRVWKYAPHRAPIRDWRGLYHNRNWFLFARQKFQSRRVLDQFKIADAGYDH